jgi:hypothetical protein
VQAAGKEWCLWQILPHSFPFPLLSADADTYKMLTLPATQATQRGQETLFCLNRWRIEDFGERLLSLDKRRTVGKKSFLLPCWQSTSTYNPCKDLLLRNVAAVLGVWLKCQKACLANLKIFVSEMWQPVG